MTLYSADIMDLAQPVEKKQRKKKEAVPPVEIPTPPETPQPKPKRVMTEKQKEALKAGQEKRRLMKQQLAEKTMEPPVPVDPVPPPPEPVATVAKPKKQRKRKETITEQIDIAVAELTAPVEPKPKKQKTVKNPEDPPVWFRKYMEGVKQEQAASKNVKTPKKQIQEEAHAEARTKWGDGLVRDRLKNEVDGHMNRMYGMIFGSRGMR